MKHLLPLIFISLLSLGSAQEKTEKKDIWFEEVPGEGLIKVWAKNPTHAPRTVRLSFSVLENLKPSQNMPATLIVPPQVKKEALLTLRVMNRSNRWNYNYHWDYTIGNAFEAHHVETHLYLLPFRHGEKYHVSQEFYGTISHNKPGSFFAIDFDMPSGTRICAARAGKVVYVKEDSTEGGPDSSFKEKSNSLTILHDDGTLAEYNHIQKDGVIVELGDTVTAGQEIALCGNTGWSTGPHLDFCVRMPQANGKNRTIPIRFRGKDDSPLRLQKGIYYYSYHPGKKNFTTFFGRDITNQTYANHRAKVPYKGNQMELREVPIDESFVVYVRNYDNKPKEVTFSLKNPTISKPVSRYLTP